MRVELVLTENDADFVPMRARTLTTAYWKLTCYGQQVQGELFNRHDDPGEMNNLWHHPDGQSIKRELMHTLLDEVLFSQDMGNGRI